MKVGDALETIADQKRTLAEGPRDEPELPELTPPVPPRRCFIKKLTDSDEGDYHREAAESDVETFYRLSDSSLVGIDGDQWNHMICAKQYGELSGEWSKSHVSHPENTLAYRKVHASFVNQSKKLLRYINESSKEYVLYRFSSQDAALHYYCVLLQDCGPDVSEAIRSGRIRVEHFAASKAIIRRSSERELNFRQPQTRRRTGRRQ